MLWALVGVAAATGPIALAAPVPVPTPGVHTHVFPARLHDGSLATVPSALGPSTATAASGGDLTYQGGPVMPVSKSYAIFWLPTGFHFEHASDGQAANAGDASYESLITRYFSDIGGSPLYNLNTQYSASGETIANTSPYGGAWVDTTHPYQHSDGKTQDGSGNLVGSKANPLDNSYGSVGDIQAEVERAKQANPSWTQNGLQTEFFVFLGYKVMECISVAGKSCVLGVLGSANGYCAYHTGYYSQVGGNFVPTLYSTMPDGYSLQTIQAGCGWQQPNGDPYADNEISITSHEHFETVTDPLGNAWYDATGNEIGDKCAYTYGPASNSSTPNVFLGGTKNPYTVQQEYSNAIHGCALSLCGTGVCSAAVPLNGSGPAAIDGAPSDDLVYTLSYQNSSDVDAAQQVTVTDTLPLNVSYNGGSANPPPDAVGLNVTGQTVLTWQPADAGPGSLPPLAPHQSGTISFHASPTVPLPNGAIADLATLDYQDSNGQAQNQQLSTITSTVNSGDATAPGKPAIVVSTGPGAGQIGVTWTPPNNGGSPLTGYTITYSGNGGSASVSASADAISVTLNGLANGKQYSITVGATNAIGTSASDPSTATTFDLPSSPTNLQVTGGNASIAVQWGTPASDGGTPVTGYTVTCTPSCGTLNPTNPNVSIAGLSNGLSYVVSVVANNLVGPGPAANASPITPSGKPGAPGTPAATPGDGSIALVWTAADSNGSAITGYTATCAKSSDGSGAHALSVGGGTLSATIIGLVNGTSYTCTVTAANANGAGPASSGAGATPLGANQPPIVSFSNPSPTAAYGQPLTFTATASDPESGDTLTWKPITGLPSGLKASALPAPGHGPLAVTISGIGSGNRVTAAAGTYPVTFLVSDGVNPTVSQILNITISPQTVALTPATGNATANPPAPIPVSSAVGTSGLLTFTAGIRESWFGASGAAAIDAATPFHVTLTQVVGNGLGIVPTAVCPPTSGTAAAAGALSSLSGRCTLNRVPVGVYDVALGVSGSPYFVGSSHLVLTVVDTSAATGFRNFGGGTLTRLQGGSRVMAAFGFLARPCSVGGSSGPQGGFVYIEHRAHGDVVVSSSGLSSCTLTGATPKTAALVGTAQRSDAAGASFNATFTVTGSVSPSLPAKLGLSITDSGGNPTDILFSPLSVLVGSRITTG